MLSNITHEEFCHVLSYLPDKEVHKKLKLVSRQWYEHICTNQYLYKGLYINLLKIGATEDIPTKKEKKQLAEYQKLDLNRRTDWVRSYHAAVIRNQHEKILAELSEQIFVKKSTWELGKPIPVLDIRIPTLKIKELERLIRNQFRKALHTKNGRGSTLLHIYLHSQLRNIRALKRSDHALQFVDDFVKMIEVSRYSTGKSCLLLTNAHGYTLVHLIIATRNETIICEFLKRYAAELQGLDMNKPIEYKIEHLRAVPAPTTIGRTMRMRRGIRRTRTSSGLFALHVHRSMNFLNMMLYYYSSRKCIKLLGELGICKISDLANARCNQTGNYPIHYAVYTYLRTNGKKAKQSEILYVIEELLEHGADTTKKNAHGYTPTALLVHYFHMLKCFMKQGQAAFLLQFLIEHTVDDIANDYVPHTQTSVLATVLLDWNYSKKLLQFLICEGRGLVTQSIVERIVRGHHTRREPIPMIGEKLRLLEELGINMKVEPYLVSKRNECMKEVHEVETRRPPRVERRHLTYKQYIEKRDFWDDLLFEKHFK